MNLLPKSAKEFSSKKYWDSFFRKRQNAFEWYGEYTDLCGVLHKYCKPKDRVLVAGCGNSQLSQDLYDVGYHSLVNIDISDVVIRQMIAKNKTKRPDMSFVKMNLLDMKFEDESFQVVIDKGTLDAIFTNEEEKIVEDVKKMFVEISRVLKIGGRYICITLAQAYIQRTLMNFFVMLNWFVRVHKVDVSSSTSQSPLPVFAFILTKTRPNPGNSLRMPQILEMVVGTPEKVNRLNNIEEIKKSIEAIQEYALVKQHLKVLHPEEHFHIDLWSVETFGEPRYSLSVVDLNTSDAKNGKFAVFIVPQGREHEWMFSEKEGQKQLAVSAAYQRLVIVSLNRGHLYTDLEKIKEELSGQIMEFAQDDVTPSEKAPFLSIGNDAGNRKLVHQGHSTSTGDYIIEDVELGGHETFRRLIFLSKKDIIQSESRLCNPMPSKSSKKKKSLKKQTSKVVDLSYLACQHHQAIIAGFSLLDQVRSRKIALLLIGLGGGSLSMFIHKHFSQVSSTIIELDADVVKVAKDWFGFKETERMKLIIDDGFKFIKDNSGENATTYDIVIFDVDSKDSTKALSSPPQQFVEEETVNNVKEMLAPGGLFMINLVCREEEKRKQIMNLVQQVIPQMFIIDIENEVNKILIFKNTDALNDQAKFSMQGKELQKEITTMSPSTNVELTSFLANLKIV